ASRGGGTPVLFRFAGQAGEVGGDGAAQLHTGSFASKTVSPADAQDPGQGFDPSHTEGDSSEILPKGQFQLRNAAARGDGASEIQKEADHQRRNEHDGQAAQSEGQLGMGGQGTKS